VPLPERLGRLQRGDRLGVGGFATVWLYHDAELDSDVAVKALAENWAQRLDVRERFLEEARILRRADSDHIVRVYDIGEEDGTPYFVMTYADLGSLARYLEPDRPMPSATVVDLVSQAGAGLSVLHQHGVVHRDIKPQNLLLRSHNGTGGERLLVADLGVAKALLHASGLTQVVGTPAYMAPEQATGGGVDIRADVHALAAVGYQMLTGQLAREGTIGDLFHATRPAPPSSLAELPPAVDEVLLRALDPDPGERYPDMPTFVHAFQAALPLPPPDPDSTPAHLQPGGATIRLTPTPATVLGRRRRRRLLLLLVCLVLFAASFGAAYGLTALIR
jgi:serine/threonine protein kinase